MNSGEYEEICDNIKQLVFSENVIEQYMALFQDSGTVPSSADIIAAEQLKEALHGDGEAALRDLTHAIKEVPW